MSSSKIYPINLGRRLSDLLSGPWKFTIQNKESSVMPDDYVDLTFDKIMWSTDKAVLFRFGNKEHWVPRSQIENPDQYQMGNQGSGEVSVQFWFVKQEGLEGFMS